MITGANTNVRYRGRIFHLQTEDSGRAHPRIVTHLYFGGTILASEKSEYDDLLAAPEPDREALEREIKARISAQHASMLARLREGTFDAVISERLGDTASSLPDTSPQLDDEPATPEPAPVAAEPAPAPEAGRGFGEGIVSQKPLDEVILEYLVDKARRRAKG